MPKSTPRKPRPSNKAIGDPENSPIPAETLRTFGDQLAGYHVGGTKLASIQEVLEPSTPTMSLAELTEQQRVELVIARLQSKPDDFTISMIGPGVINKTRAIAEVQARTRVGRTLMEIEQLQISTMIGSNNPGE
jgi:hypothetical protein